VEKFFLSPEVKKPEGKDQRKRAGLRKVLTGDATTSVNGKGSDEIWEKRNSLWGGRKKG